MFKCLYCGAEFDEPRRVPAGLFLGNPMVHEECPECGEDMFEEVDDETVSAPES